MISQKPYNQALSQFWLPNSLLQSSSTPDSYLHVNGLFTDLHDGDLLMNTGITIYFLQQFLIDFFSFSFSLRKKVPKHTKPYKQLKLSTGPWLAPRLIFNSLDDND